MRTGKTMFWVLFLSLIASVAMAQEKSTVPEPIDPIAAIDRDAELAQILLGKVRQEIELDGVAQQMLQWIDQRVYHLVVQHDLRALQVEHHRLGATLGRLADGSLQARSQGACRHHA